MISTYLVSGVFKHLRALSRGRSIRPFSSEATVILPSSHVAKHSPIYSGSGSDTVADVCAKVSPAVVQIHVPKGVYGSNRESNGSGFCIDNMGTVLTCAHVVLNNNKPTSRVSLTKKKDYGVEVTFKSGEVFRGAVKKYCFSQDLAIVKLELDYGAKRNFPHLGFGLSSNVRQGDFALAFGSPLCLHRSVSLGVISCIDRTSEEAGIHRKSYVKGQPKRLYFQTDCAIAEGSSGGAIVDVTGKVIGIPFWGVLDDMPGLGFAIPIDYAKQFVHNYYARHGGGAVGGGGFPPGKVYLN